MQQKTITCLNGEFMAAETARIPVSDRGFRFGDGVFETIRLIHGVPYQWEAHISRLLAGLAALRIAPPVVDWAQTVRRLIAENHAQNGFIRIAVSRGDGSRGYLPDAAITPTWAVEYQPMSALPDHPFKLWLSSITRVPLSALPTNDKLAHGISSTLALLEAQDHDCDEALMLSSSGILCEAASANLFWISGKVLYTPSLETGCLAGTTRATILSLSPFACHEVQHDSAALKSADAVFIANARFGIWPVRTIEPLAANYDIVHPIFTELSQHLHVHCETYVAVHQQQWARA